MNIDAYQDQAYERYGIQKKIPVFFITELLGIAMGFTPQEMQIDRHFVDPIGLLKDLKLYE
jgi:heterodisulfide reductase subunit B